MWCCNCKSMGWFLMFWLFKIVFCLNLIQWSLKLIVQNVLCDVISNFLFCCLFRFGYLTTTIGFLWNLFLFLRSHWLFLVFFSNEINVDRFYFSFLVQTTQDSLFHCCNCKSMDLCFGWWFQLSKLMICCLFYSCLKWIGFLCMLQCWISAYYDI